jgi:hypothetical protein
VRVTFDEDRDQATIYVSDERQSYERGATFPVLVHDEEKPESGEIMVQLGFEDYERLLWIKVNEASKALPGPLLAQAEKRSE